MTGLKTLTLAVVVLVCGMHFALPTADAASRRNYNAILRGAWEAPPVTTSATGQFTMRVNKNGSEATFTLSVSNLTDVTAAHLHLGVVGTTGGVIVPLYSGAPAGPFSGTLAEGTITSESLVGSYAGLTVQDLIAAIDDGDVYVNVHTSANPAGELRGQVRNG